MSKENERAPRNNRSTWPAECIWPMPSTDENGCFWDFEDAVGFPLDEETQELLDIKEYMDVQIEEGRLNPDYSLNEEYDDMDEQESDAEDDDSLWTPEKGEDYWNDDIDAHGRSGFDIETWREDFETRLSQLKIPLPSPVDDIQRIIGYQFINENLIRQAFTRRAFSLEYSAGRKRREGRIGNSENLEFLGDSVINTVVTLEIIHQLTEVDADQPAEPFTSRYDEGELSKIRQRYVCKEFLSCRAVEFGLDKYILYGSGEEPSESACEDAIEALIGAVAIDSGWNWETLANVVDRLLCIQLTNPDSFLKATHYDLFNSWHQRKFGRMPEYEVNPYHAIRNGNKAVEYDCTLRYFVPENDKGIYTSQRVDVREESRSKARERAADEAYNYIISSGLWMNLSDAHLTPALEGSINQLQELYQKKYVEQPRYEFEEMANLGTGNEWHCSCICNGVNGWGRAKSKTKAKKKAAFMVLIRLLKSAGICQKEWEKVMWEMIES